MRWSKPSRENRPPKRSKGPRTLPSVALVLLALCPAALSAEKKQQLPPALRALVQASAKGQYQLLAGIPQSDPFFDHAQALLALDERAKALKELDRKRYDAANRLSRRAQERWGRIQLAVAGGPWLRRLPDELGRVELVQARVAHAKRRRRDARGLFERAFDRMSLGLVGWRDVDAYIDACGPWDPRDGLDVCSLWVRKLLAIFPKASPERKELETRWSAVIEKLDAVTLAPPAGRIQQAYKATDEDQLAWSELLPRITGRNLRWSASLFEKFLEKFPRSQLRQKARYWMAIALLDNGPDKKAFSLLEQVARESPLSFYGLLAARQLNQEPAAFLSDSPPESSPRDAHLHPTELIALERAEALLKAGLRDLAVLELREIRIRDALEAPFLVHLAGLLREAGHHLGVFTVLTELIQRGDKSATTQWAAEMVFPVEEWRRIEAASNDREIDPIWVLSLIKQESAFDDSALSGSGAVGLMQVMPATAVDVDPTVLRMELGGRERNIAIGTSYMAMLAKRFKGNLAMATAGYNAGPQAVDRWLRESGSTPTAGLIEFIEAIPYRETRDYVGSIIRNYFWYSRKLKPEAQPQAGGGVTPASSSRNELEYFWKAPTPQSESA
jgi:soluble lytic murein transglycosylase-like protein